jgi:hypothetical protein
MFCPLTVTDPLPDGSNIVYSKLPHARMKAQKADDAVLWSPFALALHKSGDVTR